MSVPITKSKKTEVKEMGILYRQENCGYDHVIEIREKWEFSNRKDFDDCCKFLTDNRIAHTIAFDYRNTGTYNIELNDSKWKLPSYEVRDDKEQVKITDRIVILLLQKIIEWKTKGTRDD